MSTPTVPWNNALLQALHERQALLQQTLINPHVLLHTAQCALISAAHDFYNSLHIFLWSLMHIFSIFSRRMLSEMDDQSQWFPTFSPWKVRKYLSGFGQWCYGFHGICSCRDQDRKVFTGWGIQAGSSMVLGLTAVWGHCKKIWKCQSVQSSSITHCEINLWEMQAAYTLPKESAGRLHIAGHTNSFCPQLSPV
jgi:hypothetical protein